MLWGQLLQCTTAEEGNMASRLLLKACLPNSHSVHTERHTYHTYAYNRESVIWKTEVRLVIGTKLKTFCTCVFLKIACCEAGLILHLHMCGISNFSDAVSTLPSTICVGYERVPVQLQHVKPNVMPPWPKIWLYSTVMHIWPHLTVVMTVTQRITILNYIIISCYCCTQILASPVTVTNSDVPWVQTNLYQLPNQGTTTNRFWNKIVLRSQPPGKWHHVVLSVTS